MGASCNADPRCVGGSNITTFNFKRGRSYKMSLVNTGTSTHTTFWIDHHNFTVVGTDFVPIKPYTASIINIAIGQRYDIIINANARKNTRTDFWIHARDCQIGGARSNLGIIRYDPTSTTLPWTPPVDDRHVCYGCLNESPKDLKPIVRRMVKNAANEGFEKDSLKVHLVGFPNDFDPDATLHNLSLVKIASDQGWENPKFPKGYEPVDLQSYKENSWVYFLIEGKFQEFVDNATQKIYKTQAPVAHPMHIHGHDFVILDSGTSEFDPKNYTINRDNPPRRDVALLRLMHCHIAWHASGGLALQFIEQPEKLSRQFGDSGKVEDFSKTCTNWAAYYTMFNKNYNATQDDSGIRYGLNGQREIRS
ncbi:Cupredoxin [Colletotrichum phormii]|uniref:Cupredoxin n=1 Tax=Colletotrichum phormii TaxID=359342 RepID=A0AAI9ZGN5_9PEZI|nr:Cupredoxin [Colletotrichum phormii]KAK1624116.1 Cupredoxin [Colletotrichum phormii]